ncbi:MAG: M56 family metallopeptidase [Anaerolineaceae bacterium]|nr:M56 family metallopeptidase [Anaerolineaceae bacterium]
MNAFSHFLLYNLLASVAAGLVAWFVILAILDVLNIRSLAARLCFLSLPLIKSTLVLIGIGQILPWPEPFFLNLHAQAVPFKQIAPYLLIWLGSVVIVYGLVIEAARQVALRGALPAGQISPRLGAALQQARTQEQRFPRRIRHVPALLVSEVVSSPAALLGKDPKIVFPAGWLDQLDDNELAAVLAHELAHFSLRRSFWCSSRWLSKLELISPAALLSAEYLRRQEEMACDEIAAGFLSSPAEYAALLTKCYRFASRRNQIESARLAVLPRLLGLKPLLSERVEYLTNSAADQVNWRSPRYVMFIAWALVWVFLF